MQGEKRNNVIGLALVIVAGVLSSAFLGMQVIGATSEDKIASSSSGKLTPLSFISGRWITELGGDQLEEYWSPPAGDSMMGVFRWMKNGKVWMNELLTIVDEGDKIVFRLKHFDAKMVGWEEKAEALTLKLVSSTEAEAVFEGLKGEPALKFTYRKVEGNLQVRIDSTRDGKPNADVFTLRRAP